MSLSPPAAAPPAPSVGAAAARVSARLSFLDRFLPLWILLAMGIGLGLGRLWPTLGALLDRVQVAGVSLPIALGLFWMMYPVLARVRYETVGHHARDTRLLGTSLTLNWVVGPLVMFALAWVFLPDLPEYRNGLILIGLARAAGVVRRNAGASLVDIGDGVLCLEFHSKMNAIGGDTIEMIQAGVAEASANFTALVVANDAVNFSAGANLMLLLLEAQEENWDEVDAMIRAFQGATMALRLSAVPVVAAPAGLTLGGGCEIALHADRVQAAAEAYIGLVEAGVGLIPAGGGTKEMLARAMEALPEGADPLPAVQRVFETIGFGKVSTSGPDARRIGYLREADGISMDRDGLTADAKAIALTRARNYVPLQPREAIRVGGDGVLAALKLGVHLAWRAGRISDHDALIGRRLAGILAGGGGAATTVSEQRLLDLEREAFLSLCGEPKTQERIAHQAESLAGDGSVPVAVGGLEAPLAGPRVGGGGAAGATPRPAPEPGGGPEQGRTAPDAGLRARPTAPARIPVCDGRTT